VRASRPVTITAALAVLALLAGCSSGGGDSASTDTRPATTSGTEATSTTGATNAAQVTDLRLDTKQDYGNDYADGVLPVGDQHYVTDTPKSGYVYVCRAPSGGGGAQSRGPWFVNNDTEYDLDLKVAVEGTVQWNGTYTETIEGDQRVIATNDVPHDHTTGVFPVQASDPAYQYDRNPNHIAEQSLTYRVAATPTVNAQAGCIGGEVGVMTTGVALFDAFDAGGRDAGAWEVQDGCAGHPQISSEYHYHTLSSCIQDTSVITVIGWALDGFPITGPKVGTNNLLTTADLDQCHGITSTITVDGRAVTMYHYVMTQDFPYSVSCFRGTATAAPRSQ